MNHIFLAFIILVVLFYFQTNLFIKETFESNLKYKFTDLLKARRRLERLDGIKESIELNDSNYLQIKNDNPDYFYILVDSGNIGSKENSEFYSSKLGIKTKIT